MANVTRRLLQPVDFDFLVKRPEFRVAGHEFCLHFFGQRGAKASAELNLKRGLKSAAVSAKARVVERKSMGRPSRAFARVRPRLASKRWTRTLRQAQGRLWGTSTLAPEPGKPATTQDPGASHYANTLPMAMMCNTSALPISCHAVRTPIHCSLTALRSA